MLAYALTFIVSILIAVLFFSIKLKKDAGMLLASYTKSTRLVLNTNDLDEQQKQLFNELKLQLKILFSLTIKIILMLSPITIILIFAYLSSYDVSGFFDLISIGISLVAFLMVYFYKAYVKSK